MRTLIDQGPFLPDEALRVGLVDDLAYADQIDDKVKLPGGSISRLEGTDYARVSLESLGMNRGPRIAVIYASGVIMSGRSGYDPLMGGVLGSDTLIDYIREARADSSIRAIVLRIDSPGGSATASDAIWRELVITRDERHDRPLVVSMSDLAASGGYWMALAAPYIVAQPATLTGSIGVITGKMVTGGVYNKLGANIETVSEGKNAELASPARPFNDSERKKVESLIEETYDQFIEKAAAARHMAAEKSGCRRPGPRLDGPAGQGHRPGGRARGAEARPSPQPSSARRFRPRATCSSSSTRRGRSVYELLSRGFKAEQGSLLTWLLPAEERRALGLALSPLRLFRPNETLALMPAIFVD